MSDPAGVVEFRELFSTNYQPLMAYVIRRTGTLPDAQDVVSEVFAVAWRRFEVLPDDDRERRMWLYGTTRRVLANHHRSSQRAVRLAERVEAVSADTVPGVDLSEEADRVMAVEALGRLRPSDRDLLLLSLWEEFTNGQIAGIVGISTANVAVRLHRAKRRLRREFWVLVQHRESGGHVLDRRHSGPQSETNQ